VWLPQVWPSWFGFEVCVVVVLFDAVALATLAGAFTSLEQLVNKKKEARKSPTVYIFFMALRFKNEKVFFERTCFPIRRLLKVRNI
jgi:hypothetical protein